MSKWNPRVEVPKALRELRDSDIIPGGDENPLSSDITPYNLLDMALDLIEDSVQTESLLSDMVSQADEDTPSEYRTKHFRSTMDECVDHLIEKGLWAVNE